MHFSSLFYISAHTLILQGLINALGLFGVICEGEVVL